MHIQHENPNIEVLTHDNVTYPHRGDGVFEVPDEVGAELVKFPHWQPFHGRPKITVSPARSAKKAAAEEAAEGDAGEQEKGAEKAEKAEKAGRR